ncbi:hypothetical protein [Faecalibacter bovis]|uniref:Uncharacterized protein n=1 Tax=Faecalibacter bovis TaxID=2898187 RepID=A0ABX7XCK6_9FLAO|nr:hypothetical protein [Faecalibacter bovis]QTV05565.1 hypothetical protein J9309_12460 [Faecalibacter bovis]
MLLNNPTLDYLPQHIIDLIPKHEKGNNRDTIVFKTSAIELASSNFVFIKQRLLNVNNWGNFCTKTPVEFKVYDSNCSLNEGYVNLNDYIKIQIDLPTFSRRLSELVSDWVEVVRIEEHTDSNSAYFLMQLAPIECPSKETKEIEHFYSNNATKTFILYRNNQTISLSIHGRNEEVNFKVKSKTKAFRNFLVANFGVIGIDNYLWNDFAIKILKH